MIAVLCVKLFSIKHNNNCSKIFDGENELWSNFKTNKKLTEFTRK